jgi:hypothetical protein
VGSNQKRSNQKRSNRNRAAANRPGPAASTRSKGGSGRTGAATGRVPAPKRSARASGTASLRPTRPSLAEAKRYAMAPYTDGPRGKQERRAARERRKTQPLISGAPAVIRGGWPGFLILLFGELINLLATGGNGFVLLWIAIIAYAIAGNRAASASLGSTPRAVRDGALAGGFAFLLTVPLRFAATAGQTLLLEWWALTFQLIAGFVIGGLAALIAARARRRAALAGG